MAKSKKLHQQAFPMRGSSKKVQLIESVDPQSNKLIAFQSSDREKRQKKLLRREIKKAYFDLASSSLIPNTETLYKFLDKYSEDIGIVKETLESEKTAQNIWATELWNVLWLDDPLSSLKMQFLQEENTVNYEKELIKNNVPDPLEILVSTTNIGPEYQLLTPIYIISLIKNELIIKQENYDPHIKIQENLVIDRPGLHQIPLTFLNGETQTISICITLDLDKLTSDCNQAFNSSDLLDVPEGIKPPEFFMKYLADIPADFEIWHPGVTKVLKTAYHLGYWKYPWVIELLDQWRTANLTHAMPLAKITYQEKKRNLSQPDLDSVELSEDIKKFQILHLPPLIEYDLQNVTPDLNVLQLLFRSDYFRHLKAKTLDQFSDEDIRSLSYGITVEISKLKYPTAGPRVGPRPLAMIFLTISKLQFIKLDIGTADSAIRLCLSGYSTRMGEYLIEQHNRFDSARDYYLDALSLNVVSRRQYEFPLKLYFKSFFYHAYLPPSANFIEFLKSIKESEFNDINSLRDLSRGILELGLQQYGIAENAFSALPERIQKKIFLLIENHLGIKIRIFSEFLDAYKKENQRLVSLFQGMLRCSSIQGIVYSSAELVERIERLGFLLNPTNKTIAETIVEVNKDLASSTNSKNYEEKIKDIRTALTSLDTVISFGADNRTTMWADHFNKIASHWINIIKHEVAKFAQDISPILNVTLAEENMSFNTEKKMRVIFRVSNTGNGTAESINIRFFTKEDNTLNQPQVKNFRLEPQDTIESYFIVDNYQDSPMSINHEITYIDPDGKLLSQISNKLIQVNPTIPETYLKGITNPFRSDKEVDDARMFVGRDKILEEVYSYAVNEPLGGLIMLHGQKRVGKSSLLSFIEKKIDSSAQTTSTLAVRVSWLDYSAHSAINVIYELLIRILEKNDLIFNNKLPPPSLETVRTSYSFAFNELLRQLNGQGINRVILLIDEFDVIVNQIDDVNLGFNRMFFEYLRGLSKRSQVALVLTGGEKMPILFDRMGEVFNHDRTWRIGYLDPSDGSVERLIENDYIKGKISFNQDSIVEIKETSSCNPYFIQMLCQEIIERCKAQMSIKVCKLDVQEVAHALVHNTTMTKSLRHLYAPFENPDYLDMAIIGLVAKLEMSSYKPQYVEKKKIIQQITKENADHAIEKISELIRREVLKSDQVDQNKVRIMLPLFRDWFISNQPEYDKWIRFTRS